MKAIPTGSAKNLWRAPLISILLGLMGVALFWRSTVDIEQQWSRALDSLPVDTAGVGLTLSFYQVVIWPSALLLLFFAGFFWPRRPSK